MSDVEIHLETLGVNLWVLMSRSLTLSGEIVDQGNHPHHQQGGNSSAQPSPLPRFKISP